MSFDNTARKDVNWSHDAIGSMQHHIKDSEDELSPFCFEYAVRSKIGMISKQLLGL